MRILISIVLIFILSFQTGFAISTSTTEGRGYVGKLPNLSREYTPKNSTQSKPEIIPSKDFNSENDLKPIPKEDPTFVNIILKKEKNSQYINDLTEFLPILENLTDLIEKESSVQLFNAKVYYFNKNAEYFRDKYLNKPESQFVSYKKLLELSTHAKSIAMLRNEAIRYNPYLASSQPDYIYNPNNVKKQIDYLKTEIEQTIIILKDAY